MQQGIFDYFDTNIKLHDSEETTKQPKVVGAIVYRTSPVRISPAISLEPYQGDTEMLTNKYQGDKVQAQPNIATSEIHKYLLLHIIN